MANHCWKHSLLSRLVLRTLLYPSIDPRLHMDRPPMRNPYSGIKWFVLVARLRASALPLSLNVLMLYDNMEKMTKLHVSIFALFAWTNYSSEFTI